jgi:hypothetical protein
MSTEEEILLSGHLEISAGPTWGETEKQKQRDSSGMTLRQWYAGQALTGIAALDCGNDFRSDFKYTAKHCFKYADAMIAHEEKEKSG